MQLSKLEKCLLNVIFLATIIFFNTCDYAACLESVSTLKKIYVYILFYLYKKSFLSILFKMRELNIVFLTIYIIFEYKILNE